MKEFFNGLVGRKKIRNQTMRRLVLGSVMMAFSLLTVCADDKLSKEFLGYWQIDLERTFVEIDRNPSIPPERRLNEKAGLKGFITRDDTIWVEINDTAVLMGTHIVTSDPKGTNVGHIDLTNRVAYVVKSVAGDSATLVCTNCSPSILHQEPQHDKSEKQPSIEITLRLVDGKWMTIDCPPLDLPHKMMVWKRINNRRSPNTTAQATGKPAPGR